LIVKGYRFPVPHEKHFFVKFSGIETLDYFTQAVEKTVLRILRRHSRANGHPGFFRILLDTRFLGHDVFFCVLDFLNRLSSLYYRNRWVCSEENKVTDFEKTVAWNFLKQKRDADHPAPHL
jgi:hypothetical protein